MPRLDGATAILQGDSAAGRAVVAIEAIQTPDAAVEFVGPGHRIDVSTFRTYDVSPFRHTTPRLALGRLEPALAHPAAAAAFRGLRLRRFEQTVDLRKVEVCRLLEKHEPERDDPPEEGHTESSVASAIPQIVRDG